MILDTVVNFIPLVVVCFGVFLIMDARRPKKPRCKACEMRKLK